MSQGLLVTKEPGTSFPDKSISAQKISKNLKFGEYIGAGSKKYLIVLSAVDHGIS